MTFGKGQMTTKNRLVTTGESVNSTERRQPGQVGLAPQLASFVRRRPTQAKSEPSETYPQGIPRGGEIPNRTDLQIMTHAKGLATMITRCVCGKICMNPCGFKIHQGKMKCLDNETQVQHTGVVPGEMQEGHGPDSPHRAPAPPLTCTPDSTQSSPTVDQMAPSIQQEYVVAI